MGPDGIWLAFAVSNVLAAGLAIAWFRRGTWRDADLSEAEMGQRAAFTDD
jgi:Na+-driven multidrug efflux pump